MLPPLSFCPGGEGIEARTLVWEDAELLGAVLSKSWNVAGKAGLLGLFPALTLVVWAGLSLLHPHSVSPV